MQRRKVFTGLLLAAGSLLGSLFYRRRTVRRRERVDLFAEDGTMISVADGSPETERILGLARDLMALPE